MRSELLARYVARLHADAVGYDSIGVDVPYMPGKMRHDAGRPWLNPLGLVYRAQRYARLGYADAAHGRPVRRFAGSKAN